MKRKKPVLPSGGDWEMTGHVCRFCLARVLKRGEQFVCSTCSASTMGSHIGICGCGMHLGPVPKSTRDVARMKYRVPQGFRCSPNPQRTDSSPSVNVIFYLDAPAPDAILAGQARA